MKENQKKERKKRKVHREEKILVKKR